jgi:hypothetical protein
MWKIFSVPCGSALYKFHCISMFLLSVHGSVVVKDAGSIPNEVNF